jgi:hypothetical protein
MSANKGFKSAFGRFVLTTALVTMPILTACGGGATQQGSQAQTVEVHLKDGAIQMPASVPTGKTTFEVVNDGTAVHGFQIEGPAGQKQVDVAPGKTAQVEMILDPGTYRVHSPKDQNMVVALNVTQS